MRVVVTGGAGFIGSHTVARLVTDGHDVTSADIKFHRLKIARVKIVDFRHPKAIYPLFKDADAVVHLANYPTPFIAEPRTVFSENVAMNANVLQVVAELGIKRIVFSSSIQALSGVPQIPEGGPAPAICALPADGDTPTNAGNLYGLSKVLTEHMLAHYVRLYGMSAVGIRFPWVPQKPEWLRGLSELSELNPQQRHDLVSWLWIGDATALISAVLQKDLPGYRTYFPSGPLPLSLGSIDEVVSKYYADAPRRNPETPLSELIDISRITAETGWAPHSIEEVMTKPEATREVAQTSKLRSLLPDSWRT